MPKPSDFTNKKLIELWTAYKVAGGTQKSLADAAGVDQAQVSIWLRGKRPSVDSIVFLAKGFGVPVMTLIQPDDSLLGQIVAALPTLDQDQLRRVLAFVNTTIAVGRDQDQDSTQGVKRQK